MLNLKNLIKKSLSWVA